jgi:cytochrome c oxidase subunit 4
MVHHPGEEHVDAHPQVGYFSIFLALCGCTALSVALDIVHFTPRLLVFLVLAVALAKALFVMVYFMHLKFEGGWKFVILTPTVILALGLIIALAPDLSMHYYTPDAPQFRTAPAAGQKEPALPAPAHAAPENSGQSTP